MNRVLVMMNDSPYGLMPEGTSDDEAYMYARKLQDEYPANVEIRERMRVQSSLFDRVLFHTHQVSEIQLPDPDPTGNLGTLMLARSLASGGSGR